jgi:hypothetical protein
MLPMRQWDLACGRTAARQHGLITRAQVLANGMSESALRHRVERGRLQALHPGVYTLPGVPDSWDRQLLAACYWSTGVASHRSAAQLYRLPGCRDARLEVTVHHCHLPPRCGILLHFTDRLPPHHRNQIGAIPVTSIERTLFDLGAVLPRRHVGITVDDALRRSLTSLGRLHRCLKEIGGRGRRGTAALRQVLADRTALPRIPESPLESMFLELVSRSPLPRPEVQYEIWEGARFLARVDFAYPAAKVAIELDGFEFHSGRESFDHDRRRLTAISALGWRLQLLTHTDVTTYGASTLTRLENLVFANNSPLKLSGSGAHV